MRVQLGLPWAEPEILPPLRHKPWWQALHPSVRFAIQRVAVVSRDVQVRRWNRGVWVCGPETMLLDALASVGRPLWSHRGRAAWVCE